MTAPIIAIGGPVGAGKSSVAALLAQEIDRQLLASARPDSAVRLLRSDVMRKQILGVDPLVRLPRKYYETDLYSRAIYNALHAGWATGMRMPLVQEQILP